ncbi:PPIase cyclophilin-type domain-containing protein, partial [Haematococcus lacustris]
MLLSASNTQEVLLALGRVYQPRRWERAAGGPHPHPHEIRKSASNTDAPVVGPVAEQSWLSKLSLGIATASIVGMSTMSLQFAPPAEAMLTAGDPIKNATTLLRNALPINNKPIREIQRDLEGISEALRIPGSKNLGPVARAVRSAQGTLNSKKDAIIADFAPDKK